MRICANPECGAECALRYCDVCYKAHQSKLTNKCQKCAVKILATRQFCQVCEVKVAKPNLCRTCPQTCRPGSTQCSDCRDEQRNTSSCSSTSVVLDKICEQCNEPSDAKYCVACREKYHSVKRPCAECGKAETNGQYCEECITRYNANRKEENKCQDCGYKIQPGKKWCSICVAKFKNAGQNPCHTTGCSNRTSKMYCGACTIAFKASRS